MNDKTEQALTDALIDQIESAARASFRRHQSSIKGQILTAADNYDWHLLHAAYQAGIHAMRAQLAEAQTIEPLSDGRILGMWPDSGMPNKLIEFARCVEAAHGIGVKGRKSE